MSASVVAAILQTECNFTDGMIAEEILKEAMSKGKDHWMASTENIAFDAAIVVAYLKMNDADRVRLKATTDSLKAFNAMISGVPVSMEAVLERVEGIELFPLHKMWQEAKP